MANLEVASRSLVFEMHLKKVDGDLYAKLVKNEFTSPPLWTTFFEGAPGTPALHDECRQLARDVGGGPEVVDKWAQIAYDLHTLARGVAGEIAQRTGSVDGFALLADMHHHQRCAETRAVKRDLRVLEALGSRDLSSLPTEWRGKRYKRCEGPTEQARADAERKERTRKGKELADLLLEAGSPAAHDLKDQRATRMPFTAAAGASAQRPWPSGWPAGPLSGAGSWHRAWAPGLPPHSRCWNTWRRGSGKARPGLPSTP